MSPDDSVPVTLRVAGRLVVVVGGGLVALRQVRGLLEAGALVRVVAPEAVAELADLAAAGRCDWARRPYAPGDLRGAWLAVTATGARDVDAAVGAEAQQQRTWCLDRGSAAAASAWAPAVARVEDVVVAVNAGGDPRRAARLRDGIASAVAEGRLPVRRHRHPATGHAGRVALVGGGPGDVGLLTTRARRLLAEADVVVADRLGPRAVLDELDDDVLVVDVGKSPSNHPVPQHRINEILVEHALAGRAVVRLKGGDPYVFGRGGEELAACRAAGVEVEVVPGVTSAISVPAAAGIPVTHRGVARGFTVLTGHEDLETLPGVPVEGHTVVLLMGVSALAASARALVAAGRSPQTPVAVVEDGYGPAQRTTTGTLATIADVAAARGVRPPAVVVVGEVVRLSPRWQEPGPDGPVPETDQPARQSS